MRDVSTEVVEGDLIDTFNIAVSSPAPTNPQTIVWSFKLATITIGYTLASINNRFCSSSPITTTTAEGKYNLKVKKLSLMKMLNLIETIFAHLHFTQMLN